MAEQKKILLVGDDIDQGQLRKLVLKNAGYKVTAISSPKLALLIVREKRFDLILSEVMMPGMNGIEFVEALRAIGINTPAMAITDGAPGITKEELQQHFKGILSEPISKEYLVLSVNVFFILSVPSRHQRPF